MSNLCDPAVTANETDAAHFDRIVSARFSCRAFRPDPVPDDTIRDILATAGRAASWCNIQPWHVIVTSAQSTEAFRVALTKRALQENDIDADIPFPTYEGIHLQRRREVGFMLYEAVGVARNDREARKRQALENFRMFGAPHVAIVTVEAAVGPYALLDCGGFLSGFLNSARAHGVDTIAQAALAQHSGFIRGYFDIPENRKLVCGISFGYADDDHPANRFRTPRANSDVIASFV